MSHLSSPARLLVSTKGQGSVEDVIAVDPHGPGPEMLGGAVRFANVAGPHTRSQAVHIVVGSRNQLFGIAKRHGNNHWPEDFLLNNFHVVFGIDEHGRFDKVTLVALLLSAHNRLRTLRET